MKLGSSIRIVTVEFGGAVLRKGKKGAFNYKIISDIGRGLAFNRALSAIIQSETKKFNSQGYCEIAIWHSHPIIFKAVRNANNVLSNATFEGDCTLGALTGEDLEIANGIDILGNTNGNIGYIKIEEGKPKAHNQNPMQVPAYMVHRKYNPKWRYVFSVQDLLDNNLPFSEIDYEVALSMHNIWEKNNMMAVITFPEKLNYALLRSHPRSDDVKTRITPKARLNKLLGK